jgi:hypothetical protein
MGAIGGGREWKFKVQWTKMFKAFIESRLKNFKNNKEGNYVCSVIHNNIQDCNNFKNLLQQFQRHIVLKIAIVSD